MFSRRTGIPFYIELYNIFSISFYVLVCFNIFNFSFYLFFTQLLAWIWGSIIRGHLFEWLIMIALSMEKSSFGSCCSLVHLPTSNGSPNTFCKENLPAALMFSLFSSYFHSLTVYSLYVIGKAPMYAIIPEHNIQSPNTVVVYYCHSIVFFPQATFYPPRPLISF